MPLSGEWGLDGVLRGSVSPPPSRLSTGAVPCPLCEVGQLDCPRCLGEGWVAFAKLPVGELEIGEAT